MLELLSTSENQIFAISLIIMLVIAVMEGVATLLGGGLSGFLDAMLPEVDVDIDVDTDADIDGGPFTELLGWLRVGQVPVLMLLVIFLTSFGLLGVILQSVFRNFFGFYLPGWLAVIPTLGLSLPFVRAAGGVLYAIMPKDETDAVAEKSFIGRRAEIILGEANLGSPAQAKLMDEHGNTHYVMVEPAEAEVFSTGTQVLLTEQSGAVFRCVLDQQDMLEH